MEFFFPNSFENIIDVVNRFSPFVSVIFTLSMTYLF